MLRLAACLGVPVEIIEPAGFDVSDRNLRRSGLDYLDQAAIARHVSWSDPLSEVGCPYAVRGFDYDYVGILWLDDLIRRDSQWEVNTSSVHESELTLQPLAAVPQAHRHRPCGRSRRSRGDHRACESTRAREAYRSSHPEWRFSHRQYTAHPYRPPYETRTPAALR